MYGILINNKNKKEKNKNIKEGVCIFPFKKKGKIYDDCMSTDKGDICATEINQKSRTLTKYGYCVSRNTTLKHSKKSTKKKAPSTVKKLKIISRSKSEHKMIEVLKTKRYNEEFIEQLEEMADIMSRRGEHFKARAYKNAVETIMLYPDDITDPGILKGKKSIGSSILTKLQEYVDTGKIAFLEREKANPLSVLTNVYGVGKKKAQQLIDQGITTITQLKEHPELLNASQKYGLQYYDDILQRIPRAEIEEYKEAFEKVFSEIAPEGSKFEIVGSFRRGKSNSGDIDIVITNENNDKNLFKQFLDALIEENIVIAVLSRGKVKSLTIGQLPGKTARRLDFLYSSPEEYAFATLYFTGSKNFNTAMRAYALKKQYSLNEHALSHFINKKKTEPVEGDFPTEESIFDFLGLQYIEPTQRRGVHDIKPVNPQEEVNLLTPDKTPTIPPTTTKEESEKKIGEPEEKSKTSQAKPKAKAKPKSPTLKKARKKKRKLTLKTGSPAKGALDHIEQFKKEGESALNLLSEEELSAMIRAANDAYYCKGTSILTDNQYDILREYTVGKFPENDAAQEGHTECVVEKNKVTLPYEMWSMDKIKPDTGALAKWLSKYSGPYVISCKLDGVSGLFSTEGDEPKLYTRGNGKVGQDVSHLIPYLRLPTDSPDLVIRGEFIIRRQVFEEKYSGKYSNARNFVAGLVNQKTLDVARLQDMDFVAYEVIKRGNQTAMSPSKQMQILDEIDDWRKGIVVRHDTLGEITNEILSELLMTWRTNYDYEIDGIIVANDAVYPRSHKNPKHAFAFKMVLSDQIAEAKVVDVIWTASKHGYLKPRVKIEPVVLGGAKIEYATGFNGKFIQDNNIGVGAIISLIRSGDVIPHIEAVIQPADTPLMPTEPYVWNESHVDIILENVSGDDTVNEKVITNFFKKIGVVGLAEGNVKRIIAAGFNTIPAIVNMSELEFLSVPGFKEKMAKKIYNSIRSQLAEANLAKLMAASNIFGRSIGERMSQAILDVHPEILVSTDSDEEKIKKLKEVPRVGKIAPGFVESIPRFVEFMNEIHMQDKLSYVPWTLHELSGKTIVFTGGKDKALIKLLGELGAKIGSSVSKNTFVLIAKDKDATTGKVQQGRDLGVDIMTVEEFKERFNL